MKKYLVIAVCVLLAACGSDDLDNVSQNNAPSGILIKVEVYFPTTETNVKTNFNYNSSGKIESINSETRYDGETTTSSEKYEYNSNNQIWKTYVDNALRSQYSFTNNLITSTVFVSNQHSLIYTYNDLERLIKSKHYDENNILISETNNIYDNEGNLIGTNGNVTNSYDDKNNPFVAVYEGQELSKLYFINPSNVLNKGSIYTYDYEYNSLGFPITSNEYQNEILVGQTIYNYQE